MLSCDEALELISARLDGPLSGEETDRLEEHLSACPACRTLSAELSVLRQELPDLAVPAPAGLKEGVMEQIRASKVTPFQGKKRQWRWRSLASMAAVLALIVVSAGTVGKWRSGGMAGAGSNEGVSLAAETAAGGAAVPAAGEKQISIPAGKVDLGNPQSGPDGAARDSRSAAPEDGAATYSGLSGDESQAREEALCKLAAWLGWSTDGLTVGEDGTMTGPTAADGTTSRLICAGLNETGTGWLCQLEQVSPGSGGDASCTGYTVPLDGGAITQP